MIVFQFSRGCFNLAILGRMRRPINVKFRITADNGAVLHCKLMSWAGCSEDEKSTLLELLLEKDRKLDAFQKRFRAVAKGRS
jgi:hypothetical protein